MPLVQRLVHHPADIVTGTRATLAVVVAVHGPGGWGLALIVLALALDWVDGRVARRTGTVSTFGARFDMETDAFLIAVLSWYVASDRGWWWVLLIGAMRYLLWAGERVAPWLRRPVPPRHWRKVAAAVQGVVLAVAASDLVPGLLAEVTLLLALGLLVESFGRDVWWLWRSRATTTPAVPPYPYGGGRTLVALGTVWLALVLPRDPADLLRLPVDALIVVAVALLPWRRVRALVAAALGVVLAALVVVGALDAGFETFLDRPFDPLADWTYLGSGVGVLGDSIGVAAARATAVAAGFLVVVVLVLLPLATVRVARAGSAHRRPALVVAGVLVLVGVAQLGTTSAATLAYDEVAQVRADLADQREFSREIAADDWAGVPSGRLLHGLRGKDVLVVFVESYGRVAVQGTGSFGPYSPPIDRALEAGTRRLTAAGYGARSAFLTSPTFGAGSWLAHSTLQSGLWVDSQRRYDQLLDADRLTLTSAFGSAGWRTVFDVPADTRDWPEGEAFYGFDGLYDSRNVGYAGPEFGYAPMPDQYTLDTFQRRELDPVDRPPVMAEIDLISSHHPWTPLPHLVPWDQVRDGSVFGDIDGLALPDVQDAYAHSIRYTWHTLVSWLTRQPDPDLVLLVLGDHQPHSYVTGADPGHDVPVSLISPDPAVLRRIDGWGWQPGLLPTPDAPVWRMDTVRDRFLESFSR